MENKKDARDILYDNVYQTMIMKGGLSAREQGKVHGRYLKTSSTDKRIVELFFLHTCASSIERDPRFKDEKSEVLKDFQDGVLSILQGEEEKNQ